MSATPATPVVASMIRELLLQGDAFAERARDAQRAVPPDIAAHAKAMSELRGLFQRDLQSIYAHIYTAPGRTIAKEFQYRPTGVAPFSSIADAFAGPSVIVLGGEAHSEDYRHPSDNYRHPIEIVAAFMHEWRARFETLPKTAEVIILAVRALGLMGHTLRNIDTIWPGPSE